MAWTSIEALVADCREAAAGSDPVAGVQGVLADAVADPVRVADALPAFDGDEMTLAEELGFSVFLVRQDPDTAGPPHDHRMTAVIAMVDGVEIHRHFTRDGETIAAAGESRIGPGETLALDPDAVHAIANPEPSASVGIHVYLGDLAATGRTLWDLDTGVAMAFTADRYNRLVTPFR